MLSAVKKSDKAATKYELSTDFEYTGLKEYPRPQLQRKSYFNLNGKWDYRIKDSKANIVSSGKIEVPFSPEARLSGTDGHILLPDEILEYRHSFNLDKIKQNKHLILHFGAVDQVAHLSINGRKVGSHEGGYTSFSFDITDFIIPGDNEIKLVVRDYTDRVGYARGKQTLEPGGMWYTAQSGIWQTVWMEWVPKVYIKSINYFPNIKDNKLNIRLEVSEIKGEIAVNCAADAELIKCFTTEIVDKNTLDIAVELGKFKLWSPEEPNLYFINLNYGKDAVNSYFAMREFGIKKDEKGIMRLTLNGEPYFFNGLLDQGYYPESLMTPPSDDAMIYDIETMKSLGFNMLRKHCKIEPMRWYFHCDRIGMVVWQDIVNGGTKYNMNMICNVPTVLRPWTNHKDKNNLFLRYTGRRAEKARKIWFPECSETMNQLKAIPSIGLWTLFNEGWGQFDAADCLSFAREFDTTRPIDAASGWFHEECGDVRSDHYYFEELKVIPQEMPFVISEYGGFALRVGNHYFRDALYGYKTFDEPTALQAEYDKTMEKIKSLIDEGLCGAVYTQVTDVEDELNGILTYDRKVQKLY